MLVTGKNGIGVKEMPHVASHAHARNDFVSKYNLASPTVDVTIPNLLTSLLSRFDSLLTGKGHGK
jgi:hypothetical protein